MICLEGYSINLPKRNGDSSLMLIIFFRTEKQFTETKWSFLIIVFIYLFILKEKVEEDEGGGGGGDSESMFLNSIIILLNKKIFSVAFRQASQKPRAGRGNGAEAAKPLRQERAKPSKQAESASSPTTSLNGLTP